MSNESYDAIIIGTGVIGAAIGYELAKAGRRTLNIDKLPAAGCRSTSSSGAIVRFSYSTRDGVAMAGRQILGRLAQLPRRGRRRRGLIGSSSAARSFSRSPAPIPAKVCLSS